MEERTPGRRSFLLPGPTFSGFLKPGKVGFSFSYKLKTDARNGPPPGWAGWGRRFVQTGQGRLTCHVQRLPLGGKLSPKVTDEGAILYPTFPCRKPVPNGLPPVRRLSSAPLGTRSPPHPSRLRRATFPPRGRLRTWCAKIQSEKISRKKVSKSGPVGGPRKRPATALLRFPTQKMKRAPASGFKNPGAGRSPAILSPCFLIKKAGPPPGRRGNGALRPEAGLEAGPIGSVPPGEGPRPHPPGPLGLISPGRGKTSNTPSPAPPRGWGGPAPAAGRRSAGGTPPRRRRPPGASGRRGRGS